MICPGYTRTIYSDPRQPFVSNQSWNGGTSSLNRSVIPKDCLGGGGGGGGQGLTGDEKSWNRNIWPYRYMLYFLTNRLCQAVVQYYVYIGLVLCIQSVDRVERAVCLTAALVGEIPRYVRYHVMWDTTQCDTTLGGEVLLNVLRCQLTY